MSSAAQFVDSREVTLTLLWQERMRRTDQIPPVAASLPAEFLPDLQKAWQALSVAWRDYCAGHVGLVAAGHEDLTAAWRPRTEVAHLFRYRDDVHAELQRPARAGELLVVLVTDLGYLAVIPLCLEHP